MLAQTGRGFFSPVLGNQAGGVLAKRGASLSRVIEFPDRTLFVHVVAARRPVCYIERTTGTPADSHHQRALHRGMLTLHAKARAVGVKFERVKVARRKSGHEKMIAVERIERGAGIEGGPSL